MISIHSKKILEKTLDFMYGYLFLKAYFFNLRLGLGNYPNEKYVNMWKKYFKVDIDVTLKKALKYVKLDADVSCMDICDAFDRSSYFALIHPHHPNITLGFIRDADLWSIWLEEAPYNLARNVIADLIEKGCKVVDFGCGCISPLFYGKVVGPNGVYTGVDYSHSMLRIAESKIKNERLDWVNLRKENVETKLAVKKKYDAVICSSILQYTNNTQTILRNAGELTNYDGTLIVFSELFRDVEPEKYGVLKLYYSLIPSFVDFPSLSEILESLDRMGANYKYKLVCRNILKIELSGK